MLRTKSGLPKYCGWNLDREDGKRRVRFRKNGFSVYLTGIPWSPEFMAQYALALQGVQAQTPEVGAQRTIPGTINALVAAYLDRALVRRSRLVQLRRSAPVEISSKISGRRTERSRCSAPTIAGAGPCS
jgi:hypothetical protein